MQRYNWELSDWKAFQYSLENLEASLIVYAEKAGQIEGMLASLSMPERSDAEVSLLLSEAMNTAAIEGEFPNRNEVMSSIRKNLGLAIDNKSVHDIRAAALANLMTSARQGFKEMLSSETLWNWHRLLFAGNRNIEAGVWRTHQEPMQVISGAIGKEKIHFEAPPSIRVPDEMKQFINWFNTSAPGGSQAILHAPVRAAIAHLYFESIHPFEDGNGRIGRAIAEKALSQGLGRPVHISLSTIIEANRKAYYTALQQAQQSNTITAWIQYFIAIILQAQNNAEAGILFTLEKVKFFHRNNELLNQRQRLVITRMMQEGPQGFTGGIHARKYIAITGTSKATATRDLQDLLQKNIIRAIGEGRSTRYEIIISP